jgi:hypothetical protein
MERVPPNRALKPTIAVSRGRFAPAPSRVCGLTLVRWADGMRRDVEAQVEFLDTAGGGRAAPIHVGPRRYRGQLFYDGHDWDAQYEFPDVPSVHPGDSVRCFITLLSPAEHDGRLTAEKPFAIREGDRVVARGRITAVLDLPESALHARLSDASTAYRDALHTAALAESDRTVRDRLWLHVLDADRLRAAVLASTSVGAAQTELARASEALVNYPFVGAPAAQLRALFDRVAKIIGSTSEPKDL